jgi:hypothetical protein
VELLRDRRDVLLQLVGGLVRLEDASVFHAAL